MGLVFAIAVVILLAVAAPVRALTMGTAEASTTVTYPPAVCSGGVQYTEEDETDKHLRNSSETVTFPYSVSWADQRNNQSTPIATHYFQVLAVHNGNAYDDDHTEYTDGQDSGSTTLAVDVPNVQDGDTVHVTYTANLSASGLSGCPILDSVTMHYHFVYP